MLEYAICKFNAEKLAIDYILLGRTAVWMGRLNEDSGQNTHLFMSPFISTTTLPLEFVKA
jgi:hypothetical protein